MEQLSRRLKKMERLLCSMYKSIADILRPLDSALYQNPHFADNTEKAKETLKNE
jgi:hypothetical protein